jgi:hypothetical protein
LTNPHHTQRHGSRLVTSCTITGCFGSIGFSALTGACALGFAATGAGFGVGACGFALSTVFAVGFFSYFGFVHILASLAFGFGLAFGFTRAFTIIAS